MDPGTQSTAGILESKGYKVTQTASFRHPPRHKFTFVKGFSMTEGQLKLATVRRACSEDVLSFLPTLPLKSTLLSVRKALL